MGLYAKSAHHHLVVHIGNFFSFACFRGMCKSVFVLQFFFLDISHIAHVCICTTAQRGSVERVACEGGGLGGSCDVRVKLDR